MLTRLRTNLRATARRVHDAQREKQEAIGQWLLGLVQAGNGRPLFDDTDWYDNQFYSPDQLLLHWEALTNLQNPFGASCSRRLLRVLRLWFLPEDPCTLVHRAPALSCRDYVWTGQHHDKHYEGTVQSFLDGVRPHVHEGSVVAQLCLVTTMLDAPVSKLWISRSRWALEWVRGVALQTTHPLRIIAVNVMLVIHQEQCARIMEYPALDLYVLSAVPNLTHHQLLEHNALGFLARSCANLPYTDHADAVPLTLRGHGRLRWSRAHGAQVALQLLKSSQACWDMPACPHGGYRLCRCGGTGCVPRALLPLLCFLLARPTACELPEAFWSRIAGGGIVPCTPRTQFLDSDFQRVLAYSFIESECVPERGVMALLQSSFLFPMTNIFVVRYACREDHLLREWACVQKLLQKHPALPPAYVRLLQGRLYGAATASQLQLPVDSVKGSVAFEVMASCLDVALVQALRWSVARGQWLALGVYE